LAIRKGLKRLTHLISVLTTVSVFVIFITSSIFDVTRENRMEVGFVYFVISGLAYSIPWILFMMIEWIIKGFREKE